MFTVAPSEGDSLDRNGSGMPRAGRQQHHPLAQPHARRHCAHAEAFLDIQAQLGAVCPYPT